MRTLTAIGVLIAMTTPTMFAQSRVEASVFGGWTLSDGVEATTPILALDGNVYDRVDPKDSGSWGFDIGFMATDNAEFGFIFGHQFSTLVVGGTNDREIGDLAIKNYHGYFAYNWGEADARVRPFAFGGLGATNFGSVDFAVAGRVGTTGSETQFSTRWGAGVKVYPHPNVGFRGQFSMTPTYIKTDSAGWWCDPYWGCYVVGDAQYSNQFEFSGGVTVRF